MYPYSNYPPNEQPNQGSYPPPYNYPPNQDGYPPYNPYNYQGQPQPGQYYYQARPSYGYPILRAFGIALLIFFFLALFGRHGFFFWPLIIVGIVLFVNRHRMGYSNYNRYNRWHNYNYHRPYSYSDYNQPGPGHYNYPPQPTQSQTPPTGTNPGSTGWPTPAEEPKTNNPI